MKKTILIFLIISTTCCSQLSALWTNKTMMIEGLTRSYRVYQSPNYSAFVPASLLIALHGLGDNMTNFSNIGLNNIADTANIICVFPQAVTDSTAGASWNAGVCISGYYPNTTINDIGFINAMIDTVSGNYAIDCSRVYLCGFSMGGFMTERMALQSNAKIAAFVSMSGTIGSGITTYNPGRHVPIAHFHGTADKTVYYTGDIFGIDPDSLIHFWVINNGCNSNPATYNYPDLVNDSITVERFEYSNGDIQSDVWFYKMNGADHTLLFQPWNDITETVELWLFMRRHTLITTEVIKYADSPIDIHVFPNPANDKIIIDCQELKTNQEYTMIIFNSLGQIILQQEVQQKTELDVSGLSKGIYMARLSNGANTAIVRLMKE